MLKRLRTAHPILYCIQSEVLFLGSMVVFSLLATIVLAAAGADFDTMDGYLFGSVQEAVGLAVALLLLARTGRLDLLRRRGCGFLNGLLVGMYPLFFIGYTAFGTLAFGRPDTPLLPLPRILTFLLNMILVGVAESVSGYDASRLLSVAVYLIPTLFLLRKKKLPEVQLYWGGIVKN